LSTRRIVLILFLGLLARGQTPKPGAVILAPVPLATRLRVTVDPGHGGDDRGAQGQKGLKEKEVALELALILREHLQEAGFEVILTREEDVLIPVWDRAKLANEAGADLFISLHLNAAKARAARGSEVFFLSQDAEDADAAEVAALENQDSFQPYGPDSVVASILNDMAQKAFLQDSEKLAVAVQNQLNRLGGIKERGVKQAPFAVLRSAAMPAILVETAFISNPKEEIKLKDPAFLKKVAEAITLGVKRFFTQVGITPKRKALDPISAGANRTTKKTS
jgi:N-acetylmuramoyl-L-alanine amidase